MSTLYQAVVTAAGARAGHIKSNDGVLDHNLSVPEGMGGDGGDGTNPEQLFGGAYAACFGGALQVIAKKMRVDLGEDFTVTATIGFNKNDEEGAYLSADLDCYLPTVDVKKGEKLINAAHEICPFSKATRDNITVNLNLLLDE